MHLSSLRKRFDSSATVRIYIFRAVLLSNTLTIIIHAVFVGTSFPQDPLVYGCSLTMLHHIAMLYPWPVDLVVLDFFLVLAEVFGLFTLIMVTVFIREFQSPPWTSAFSAANVTIMCFSLYFRYVGYTPGRFNLLGGCDTPKPPYNRVTILLGRSASRPLVRGEPRAIVFCRAIILASLCFVIPAFGSYVALYVPSRAVVMTRNVKVAQPWPMQFSDKLSAPELITVITFYTGSNFSAVTIVSRLTNSTVMFDATDYGKFETCSEGMINHNFTTTVTVCPYSWPDLSNDRDELFVWADFSDPSGILYVKTGQGDPSDVNSYAEAIPLLARSHLSVLLSRKQRDLFSKKAQDLFLRFRDGAPFKSITLTPVLLLQPDPSPPSSLANVSSLRIRMRDDIEYAGEIVQDYADASVLNGLATFGGFWTFVNSAFVMLFEGNLLYFLLRRRPLSALGIVHIFQRRKLTRKWNEDFPALRTEGGLPGSNSAGVVAFLRERLVDLDDEDDSAEDLESQKYSSGPVHLDAARLESSENVPMFPS